MLNPTANGIRTVYGGAATLGRELFMEIRDLRFDASAQPATAGAAIRQECDPQFQSVFLVRNCWFQKVWDGINTSASGGTIVKNCTFLDPLHAAIHLEQRVPENTDVGAVHIANNFFFDKNQASGAPYGVLATTGGSGMRLQSNTFIRFQHPIMFDMPASPVRTGIDIDDNLIDGVSTGSKIHIKGPSEIRSFNICNNQINAGQSGIQVEVEGGGRLWRGVISGNVFNGKGAGGKGIVLNPQLPNAVVRDVTIAGNHFNEMDVGIELANDRCKFISLLANSFNETDPGPPPVYGVVTPLIDNGSLSRGAFFPDRVGVGRANDVPSTKDVYVYSGLVARPRVYLEGNPAVVGGGMRWKDILAVAKSSLLNTSFGSGLTLVPVLEGPEYLLYDSGSVTLSDSGEAWVDLDPRFVEIANTDMPYRVMTSGCKVPEKEKGRFRLRGDPGEGVDWMVVAVRAGFENVRFRDAQDAEPVGQADPEHAVARKSVDNNTP